MSFSAKRSCRVVGTTFVPRGQDKEGFKGLANWAYRQRRLLWEYELSRDRKELLDAIGFEFGEDAIASANMVKEKAAAESQLQKELEDGHRKRKRTPVITEPVKEEAKPEPSKRASQKTNKDDDSSDTGGSSSDEDENPNQHSKYAKKEQDVYVQMWLNKCAELKAYKKKNGKCLSVIQQF